GPTLVVSTTAGDITITAVRPFWVDGDWVAAGDLEAGGQLHTQTGTGVTVTSLSATLDVATVYNLTRGKRGPTGELIAWFLVCLRPGPRTTASSLRFVCWRGATLAD
ncbi:MAG: hypothetical protein LBJ08_11140, partial [Bifidobacteriaceae bacterium]|nr:hypothetical protein [Bifidobacteriaceae bacterium]